jgi:phage tail-like protein
VDLVWKNPTEANFRGVKILRREVTFPEVPGDLDTVFQIHDEPVASTPAGAEGRFSDLGLKSETVYYYAVAAYDDTLPDPKHFPVFISSMATGAYQSAATMYRKLPALYQRFDLLKPPNAPELDPADSDKGQLLRFIELVGPQFDLLRSFAKGAGDFSDVNRIDGDLLPLLASWIGWESGFNLSLAKQRNEINYAPHFYRTTGIAANLRATLNRITPWPAQIKEFVHNVFRSNDPEQLTIWEIDQLGVAGHEPQLVTLDFAYEGKPVAVAAAGSRLWLFFHAQRSVPTLKGREDRWQIYYKVNDQGAWLPSRRLTEGRADKYPAAIQRPDGSFWLFWTAHDEIGGRILPQIRSEIFTNGRDAQRPQKLGTLSGPFNFADGDEFRISVTTGTQTVARTVTLHLEHFQAIAAATAAEIATLLDREIPGVEVSVNQDGKVLIEAVASGSTSSFNLPASPVATDLGLTTGVTTGSDATSAQLLSSLNPTFNLAADDTLAIRIDSDATATVTFKATDFVDITAATAAEISAAINRVLPGIASDSGGRVMLASPSSGESSFVTVLTDPSSAAGALGFGLPLPPAAPQLQDDSDPTVFQDAGNNVWLFWSSRRAGGWNIWYNRFDGTNWGVAKQLTTGAEADREPCAVFDSAGRIWVFWSRKKSNGLWNIFYRTTTDLDFALPQNWVENELTPVPADFENKEPATIVTAANTVQLFFASSGTDGWHIRSSDITPATQSPPQPITSGQFSHRAPAALRIGGSTRFWFRNNESREYISEFYPAARTVDARYSGSTTVVETNAEKIKARDRFEDVERYTYDTARFAQDWYARDTIGLFLTADTDDQEVIAKTSLLIENTARRFLPIQVRVVLIVTSLAGFRFFRTWIAEETTGVLPNLAVTPPDLSFRLFLNGVTEGV